MGRLGQGGQAEEAVGAIVFQFQVHTRISEDLKKSLGLFLGFRNFFLFFHRGAG